MRVLDSGHWSWNFGESTAFCSAEYHVFVSLPGKTQPTSLAQPPTLTSDIIRIKYTISLKHPISLSLSLSPFPHRALILLKPISLWTTCKCRDAAVQAPICHRPASKSGFRFRNSTWHNPLALWMMRQRCGSPPQRIAVE